MSAEVTLVGERVMLAPLRPDDSPALFEWINDRALVVLSAPYRQISRAEHDEWFDDVRRRSDVAIFGIRLNDGDRLVGSCQLQGLGSIHRDAELRIRIGAADARGRGLATEATQLLLRHAFDGLRLHRVFLHVFETNEAAKKLYDRVGFRTEGMLREAAWIEGEWIDVRMMAILESEFRR